MHRIELYWSLHFLYCGNSESHESGQGIIEGDQIEVAAFSLESFVYLTGLVTVNNNAGSNSARARRLTQI